MNGTNRRMPIIAGVVLALLILILAGAVVAREINESRLSRDIAAKKQLLADYKKDLCDCRNWRKDYSSLCLKLGGRMPQCSWSDQMPFIVAQLTGIVESRGLKIESLQPQPMTEDKPVERFPLRIGLQTDLASLTSVMEDIEKTVPLLEIERLDIRDKDGKLQADMTVSSYVVIDKDAPVVKKRKLPEVTRKQKPSGAVETAKAAEAKPAGAPGVKAAPVPTPVKVQKPVVVTPSAVAPVRQTAERTDRQEKAREKKVQRDERKRMKKMEQQGQKNNRQPVQGQQPPAGENLQVQPQGGAR